MNPGRWSRKWLLWLALLLPLAQAMAGAHALSHVTGEKSGDSLAHFVHCDLCLTAADLGPGPWGAAGSPTWVGPLIEISSSPSAPCTVIAWRAPKRCSTRTWMPTRSGWNTPMTWVGAEAGLVKGPRMLKSVRTPSSLRTGAACFIAA